MASKKSKKNIMFKKIHFGYSILSIMLLSIIPATLYFFIFLNVMASHQASAASVAIFGGRITTVKECILDTPPPPAVPQTCATSCPLCTTVMPGTTCSAATEVAFTPFGGIWSFVCPSKAFLYYGGRPSFGGLILGYGVSQSQPQVIGVGN